MHVHVKQPFFKKLKLKMNDARKRRNNSFFLIGFEHFANSSKQMCIDKWLIGKTSDRTSDFECRHQSGPTSR